MQGVARDILSSRIVVIDAALPIERAEALLLSHQVEELFVTDADGRLLGVLPDYALLRWRLLPDGARRVAEIMSAGMLTARPDTPLVEIAARLRMHVHARIPILEGDRLVGVVARRAVLQRLALNSSRPPGPPIAAPHTGALTGRLSSSVILRTSPGAAASVLADQL
jgi:CBS domain-containing protein